MLKQRVGKQSEAVTPVDLRPFLGTVTAWLQIGLLGGRRLGSLGLENNNNKETETT